MPSFSRKDAEREIGAWLESDVVVTPVVECLARSLTSAHHILLVGGVLRDHLIRPGTVSKDVDVIVDGMTTLELAERLPRAKRNFYGGLNLEIEACTVDIWPLADTYHIREFGLEPTISNFLGGAPFNMDKVAYDITTRRFFEKGFLRGLRQRTIHYAPRHAYLEHVQAARGIMLRRKTGFVLDASVRSLLVRADHLLHSSAHCVAQVHEFLVNAEGIHDLSARREVLDEIASSSRLRQQATAV
ncbi:MAG: hypothetical protein PVI30_20645 [Myxococcales bacterium]|jgi:hypothetical protein